MPVSLDYKSDHLVIRLVGRSVITALRRNVLIPYSSISGVQVEAPRWPSAIKAWRIGTHLPGIIAHGTFTTWQQKHRRFCHFEKATRQVVTLRLSGHPQFDEVSIDARDPLAVQTELQRRMKDASTGSF